MSLLFTFALVIAVVGLGYLVILRLRPKPQVHADKLMLSAVRRRTAGVQRSLELTREEHSEINALLEKQWQILHERWIGVGAQHLSGFISDAAGLPAPDDNDWRLLLLYGLKDYAMFRRCVDVLESESFNLLRHHLEIRLVPGESVLQMHHQLRRLL
ncbi:MAG TPA: hypothetical protein PKI62_06935 [bacterium]|nr:hypothetical protein [bacterium]HPR86906.1 hypothetical protein [bacterium]